MLPLACGCPPPFALSFRSSKFAIRNSQFESEIASLRLRRPDENIMTIRMPEEGLGLSETHDALNG